MLDVCRGRCQQRFYGLCQEIDLFINDMQRPVSKLGDHEWLLDLCFLVDIVGKLSTLNKGKLI